MADGNAHTSAYESFGDFNDFSSQQKDWPHPIDVDMTLRADSLYIPPDRALADERARWVEHPEAVDDDDDDDDDMFDYDFPVGPASSYAADSLSAQFAYPASTGHYNDESHLTDGYDIYRVPNSFGSAENFYSLPYKPVESIAPLDLQLSHEGVPAQMDDMPRFEPASPIDYDTMDSTPDLVNDEQSSDNQESFEFDMDLDLEQDSPAHFHDPPTIHDVKTVTDPLRTPSIDVARAEPPAAPARPTPAGNTKRKKVAHGPNRCDMVLPSGEPCNKAFTRPYDLARHQETIHAQVRKMFTCPECGDKSKTFSRMDALSRHIRIKHSRKD
ncbi:hypothetical protein B9G98_00595 [Wickerhamiella sorbophila]|uniref:C2H2-type domain-containing protein n=1 Tax=Wickerhamiella sorbophila TaxID=45607 RepID=A0A2T0FDD3_9ASCO|nr:hypothetical protein B9G98_00595 [Wickerhamiella sorbophila]PRT52975.1 hypothetical protein B9G98_00595 [Wickerhamiella sorbophila]